MFSILILSILQLEGLYVLGTDPMFTVLHVKLTIDVYYNCASFFGNQNRFQDKQLISCLTCHVLKTLKEGQLFQSLVVWP